MGMIIQPIKDFLPMMAPKLTLIHLVEVVAVVTLHIPSLPGVEEVVQVQIQLISIPIIITLTIPESLQVITAALEKSHPHTISIPGKGKDLIYLMTGACPVLFNHLDHPLPFNIPIPTTLIIPTIKITKTTNCLTFPHLSTKTTR